MPTSAKPLSHVIGERLRSLRVERGLRQDEVATEARGLGIKWTRATVAAIETGRREISLDEAVRLPWLYGVELADLVPGGGSVGLKGTSAPSYLVQAALRGHALKQSYGTWGDGSDDLAGRLMRRVTDTLELRRAWPEATDSELKAASEAASNEVEARAAQRLGVDPIALALAAVRRWGHGLTEERDRRSPEGVTSRGHITRALLDELRPDLEVTGSIDER